MSGASKMRLTEQENREECVDKVVARRWELEAPVEREVRIAAGQVGGGGRATLAAAFRRAQDALDRIPDLRIANGEVVDSSWSAGIGRRSMRGWRAASALQGARP